MHRVLWVVPHLLFLLPFFACLFFPFDLSITLPAVMIPHALIGIGEGVLTLLIFRLLRQRGWIPPA